MRDPAFPPASLARLTALFPHAHDEAAAEVNAVVDAFVAAAGRRAATST